MLTCAEVVRIASDYLDGRLTPAERRRFEEHLEICPPCRGYLTQLGETKRQLGRLKEDDLPEQMQEDLVRAFREFEPEA